MCNLPFQLESGIFLENAGVLLPWGLPIAELHQHGNGKITVKPEMIDVAWPSEKCLGGLSCNIAASRILGPPNPRAYHIYLETFHWVSLEQNLKSGERLREKFHQLFDHLKHHFGNPEYLYPDVADGLPGLLWYFGELRMNLAPNLGGTDILITIKHEPPDLDELKREAARAMAEDGPGRRQEYTGGAEFDF